jgi:hypothetical protein
MGEALITSLDEKGRPTPVAATLLRSPSSRMDVLAPEEIDEIIGRSKIVPFYNKEVDRESAYEMLGRKIEESQQSAVGSRQPDGVEEKRRRVEKETGGTGDRGTRREKEPPSVIEELSKNTMVRQVGRTLMRELTRGLFGVLTKRR